LKNLAKRLDEIRQSHTTNSSTSTTNAASLNVDKADSSSGEQNSLQSSISGQEGELHWFLLTSLSGLLVHFRDGDLSTLTSAKRGLHLIDVRKNLRDPSLSEVNQKATCFVQLGF
jgi:hypothetical protein